LASHLTYANAQIKSGELSLDFADNLIPWFSA
jgi:hypothetical protein